MTEKRTYGGWMNEDYGMSFMEYLGVQVPKREYKRQTGGPTLYRFVKGSLVGDWHLTLKAAKASYKALIKAKHDKAREERAALKILAKDLSAEDIECLRGAIGVSKRRRPSEWLENNIFLTGHEGSEFEAATRLEALGLMENAGPFKEGLFFQVTPDGCRFLGVPESRINDHHFI